MDVTGLPDPKYFRLWETIRTACNQRISCRARPEAEARRGIREAEGALKQLAGQWKERFEYIERATPGQEQVPPVMIVVCDNTDIAELVYRKISGETQVELVTQATSRTTERKTRECRPKARRRPRRMDHQLRPERHPARVRQHAQTESTPSASTRSCWPRPKAAIPRRARRTAEELRQVVATVGKRPAGRACPLRGVRWHADRGLGRQQRDAHPRHSGVRKPTPVRAGGRARTAPHGLHAHEDRGRQRAC